MPRLQLHIGSLAGSYIADVVVQSIKDMDIRDEGGMKHRIVCWVIERE
jgi:hypothetical protein